MADPDLHGLLARLGPLLVPNDYGCILDEPATETELAEFDNLTVPESVAHS